MKTYLKKIKKNNIILITATNQIFIKKLIFLKKIILEKNPSFDYTCFLNINETTGVTLSKYARKFYNRIK